ncbi:Hypothetical_protein [Hexamita inflata]|uniref:Hypothetical_protein n=1 Tax=Hexamita inflata TaxID=28002 RepID=A0AA86R719_9EUKA|nr:Hypothetical protein HINF_LOCUS56066 [Hexamita inflata]
MQYSRNTHVLIHFLLHQDKISIHLLDADLELPTYDGKVLFEIQILFTILHLLIYRLNLLQQVKSLNSINQAGVKAVNIQLCQGSAINEQSSVNGGNFLRNANGTAKVDSRINLLARNSRITPLDSCNRVVGCTDYEVFMTHKFVPENIDHLCQPTILYGRLKQYKQKVLCEEQMCVKQLL